MRQDHPWGALVQLHEVLPSTNDRAKELARLGAPEGTTVIARSQTAGRGRLGRSFHSPEGSGLYMSVILRPRCPASALMHLTCAAAVAACDAVEKTAGIRPGIKWINDLTLKGKKLGGILTELSFGPDALVDYAVVGIGINCAHTEEDFPQELQGLACSLRSVTGAAPEPGVLASELLFALERVNRQLLVERSSIMDRYRSDCVTLGRQVRVISPTETRQGLAEAVNDDGSLTVLFSDGHRQAVNSGEVSVRGLWDYV